MTIGVLLVGMDRITSDLVRQIVAGHDDIEIADAVANADGLEGVGTLAGVDVVITMHRPHRSGWGHLDRLLAAKPGLCALAIEDQGRTAVMYTLVPQTKQLGTLTRDTLVDFIRTLPCPVPAGRSR